MNTKKERVQKDDGGKSDWLTPPHIINALGEFDLDPCAPAIRPWDTAKKHYTKIDDGLQQPWEGRVWCHPPFGDEAKYWLAKCAEHGNCIALTFARTETNMFFDSVWDEAHAIFFFKGRLRFHWLNGERALSASAPSVLIAYGEDNAKAIADSGLSGKLIYPNGALTNTK